MTCLICDRIEQIREQKNAFFVAELKESYAVLADDQRYVGYTVLLLKDHVEHLHELSQERQLSLFQDVSDVTSAMVAAFDPLRINYECLGNSLAHIHWHVIPRYDWDPDPTRPIWVRSKEERQAGVSPDELPRLVSKLRVELEQKITRASS
jgi:diadenosine tetraphosphate (Ap4A) HIT family hydrolase